MDLVETLHSKLLFAPIKGNHLSPKDEGIQFEEIFIKTSDGENLHSYFFPASEKTDKILIYFHGNAQNLSAWYPAAVRIQKHISINALIFDYRGYGKSSGIPSREGVIVDAVSVYEYLLERGFKPENISLYGRSLGGAVAIELASIKKIKSLSVISTFTSLRDMGKCHYPMLPLGLIKNNLFNSIEKIKNISVPILISHGSNDEVVPLNQAYELFAAANESKKLIILKGAGHNDVSEYFNDEYFKFLKD